MKRLLPLILIFCLLLAACGKEPPVETLPTEEPTTAETQPAQTEPPTEEVTVPEQMEEATIAVIRYRHPLNGMPLEEPWTTRPCAVGINNSSAAQPLCGVGSSDFLFELRVEGGITRFVAVFSDLTGLEHIGAVRSARPHLVEVAESFDAIYIHHGTNKLTRDLKIAYGTDYVDANSNGGSAFYRDQNRLNQGYALEHTSFADGEDLLKQIDALGISRERAEGVDYGYQYSDLPSTGSGEAVSEISLNFNSKKTGIAYDEASGLYTFDQYGSTVADGNTGDLVTFRNVIILQTACFLTPTPDGDVSNATMQGEGKGYFACDGKLVPILWSRAETDTPFVFTHEDGTPITFGVGNTYVGVVPTGDNVTFA